MAGAAELAAKAPEERRRRILAAAVDVVRDKGFAGTRVADVAAAAGTSAALVVYHFGTLDGALAEALRSLEDEFYDEVTAYGGSPTARLRLLGELGTQSGPNVGDWSLWVEVWVRALRDPGTRALREALDARWRGVLRDVLRDGVAAGEFQVPDLEAAVLRLACLMDGLAVQVVLRDPEVTPGSMARLWLGSAALETGLPPSALLPG